MKGENVAKTNQRHRRTLRNSRTYANSLVSSLIITYSFQHSVSGMMEHGRDMCVVEFYTKNWFLYLDGQSDK